MAPERANGEDPRPPVDLWSLGATLYTAVEGRPAFDRGDPMVTLLAVVSEHPAPMLRAGPLVPVLLGLLTKDPAGRSTAQNIRPELEAVMSGRAPSPAPTPAPVAPAPPTAVPPPAPGRVGGDSVARIDGEDVRALASASRALLGSVARDARDVLAERRRDRKAQDAQQGPPSQRAAPPAPAPPRRRRFKRRWVVVPVLTTVVVALVLLVGAGLALAAVLDLF